MRTCQPLLIPPPLYVYTYILYLVCQTYLSSFTYKIFSMKKYLTPGNILRALTILMLIYYFNHEGMTNVYQIIDTIKSLFK